MIMAFIAELKTTSPSPDHVFLKRASGSKIITDHRGQSRNLGITISHHSISNKMKERLPKKPIQVWPRRKKKVIHIHTSTLLLFVL